MEGDEKPSQSWQDIAQEASRGQDPQRLRELTQKPLEELEKEKSKRKRQSA